MKKLVILLLFCCTGIARSADFSDVDFYFGLQCGFAKLNGEEKSMLNYMDVYLSNSACIPSVEVGAVLMGDVVVRLRGSSIFYEFDIDNSQLLKENPGYRIADGGEIEYNYNYTTIAIGLMYCYRIGDFSLSPFVDFGYIIDQNCELNYPLLCEESSGSLRQFSYTKSEDYGTFIIMPGLRLSYMFAQTEAGRFGIMADLQYNFFEPEIYYKTISKDDGIETDTIYHYPHRPELNCYRILFGVLWQL